MLVFGVRHYLIRSAVDTGGLEQGDLGVNWVVPGLSEAERAAGQCKDAVCEECGDGWRGGRRVMLLFLMSVCLIWMRAWIR